MSIIHFDGFIISQLPWGPYQSVLWKRLARGAQCCVLPCTMQRAHGQVIRTSRESQILNISKTLNIELRLHFLIGNQNMCMTSMGLGLDTRTRNELYHIIFILEYFERRNYFLRKSTLWQEDSESILNMIFGVEFSWNKVDIFVQAKF